MPVPSRESLLRQFEEEWKPAAILARMRFAVLNLEPMLTAAGVNTYFELGCGDCGLLAELQARGHEGTGFEPAVIAGASSHDVPVYPYFDCDLPGIHDSEYDISMALGSLERLGSEKVADRCIAELFRISRIGVLIVVEDLAKFMPRSLVMERCEAHGQIWRLWPIPKGNERISLILSSKRH
jgi:hypothetical protein